MLSKLQSGWKGLCDSHLRATAPTFCRFLLFERPLCLTVFRHPVRRVSMTELSRAVDKNRPEARKDLIQLVFQSK